ncbi:hypothetical protein TrVE_jg6281 [Triparma verrucosa]|uniref:Uncharacterized protein n=2 Tax=Triparma TaxID=722752 RepID=A0A9W7AHW7_9STRA|nr:hypothetical protein TrST_g752 [Triparma strigata]GMH89813.1 hypothetical protein TrVE_jg6281 [Triparma verrucosa]
MFGRKTKPVPINVSKDSMNLLSSLVSNGGHKRKISTTSLKVKNNGVEERANVDLTAMKEKRRGAKGKEAKRIKIMEEKAKKYDQMLQNAKKGFEHNDEHAGADSESLINWSSKVTQTTSPPQKSSDSEIEYQKIIDEFGRTISVPVGSTEWCTWVAQQGRESQISDIWKDSIGYVPHDSQSDYANRGHYGPPSSSVNFGSFNEHSNDKADASDLNSNKAMSASEKACLKIVEEETKVMRSKVKAEKDNEGREGIRVYADAVVLPEEKGVKGVKIKGKSKAEKLREIMELKKKKMDDSAKK